MSEASAVSTTPFAKITRPRYAHVLPRKRLFHLLDDRRHPVIWVSAPPGAGKTALISSYLDARRVPNLWYQLDQGDSDLPTFFHYLGLAAADAAPGHFPALPHLTAEYAAAASVFARRYFEAFAAIFQPPIVLVLDNYHEVSPDAALHAVLRDGLCALPQGFATIVLSRSDPPPELARMRVNDQLLVLGWDELRLTLAEVKGIERLIRGKSRCLTSHQDLYDKTQGWAGGLVLLLQQNQPDACVLPPRGATHQVLFDYFAGEIFAALGRQTQRVLLASALLRKMTVRSVVELTGFPAAGELLHGLNRSNYFTLKHDHVEPVYEYHPLFREFLLMRAEQMFEPAELRNLRGKAAALLEAEGQIEEAAELLQAAGDAQAFARLIGAHAPAFIGQGRCKVVEEWLARLPDEALAADPWLIYWQGVCRLPFHPLQARDCFERAYERFSSRGDLPGRCSAWCAIVDSLVFGWRDFKPLDRWIDEMDELLRATPQLPDAGLEAHVACGMFLALMYRQPERADLPAWERRVRHIILYGSDPVLPVKVGNHLLIYHTWWIGDLARAELLVNTLREQMEQCSVCVLTRITWHTMAAGYYSVSALDEDCIASVNRGLQQGQDAGVNTWEMVLCTLGVFGSIASEQTVLAAGYLRRMEDRLNAVGLMDKAVYYYASALVRTMQGDLSGAREAASMAVAMAEEAGARLPAAVMRNGLGIVLLRSGQHAAGLTLIRQSRAEASAMQSRTIEHWTATAEAMHAMHTGDESACVEHLRRAFAVAAERRLYNQPWWSAREMAQLYATALAHGVDTDYVTSAIRKRSLAAPRGRESIESWPWPFRIYALGGFRILKDDQALRFTGKSPRKPLELLKALIAFGGVEVNQSSLLDALWPDLEGDKAQRAFETALYRLRKLLADDAAVVLKGGKLTLDAGRVWVDSAGIEHVFQDIDDVLAGVASETPVLDGLASRLLAAYGGHFLSEESGEWAIARRERLRSRFLNALQGLARCFEAREAWDAAARCYRRALEIEPLMENLWYRLMVCHKHLAQTAEALAVYRRCRQTLSSALGIGPSEQAQALASALASANRESRSVVVLGARRAAKMIANR